VYSSGVNIFSKCILFCISMSSDNLMTVSNYAEILSLNIPQESEDDYQLSKYMAITVEQI